MEAIAGLGAGSCAVDRLGGKAGVEGGGAVHLSVES